MAGEQLDQTILDWSVVNEVHTKSLYAYTEVVDQQGKPPSCSNDQQRTFPLLATPTRGSHCPRKVPCGKANSAGLQRSMDRLNI